MPPDNPGRALGRAWLAAGAILYLSYGYTEMAGSDLWWHLAAGREILASGTLWLTDSWSFTAAGEPWNNHEWLADIIYYLWASAFGVTSLVYWKWLVIMLSFTGLQVTLLRETRNHVVSMMAAAIAIALAAPFLDVRPHLYTLLGFAVLLLLTWRRPPVRWQLLLLFVAWVNLHGGFIFGLMALTILVLPWHTPTWTALWRALRLVALCAAACLLNPDGSNVFVLPLVYAFDPASPYRQLGEWLSPFAPGGISAPLFFWLWPLPLVVASALVLPALRRRLGVSWEALALSLLTLAMALTSRRFIPIFGMSLALLLAPVLAWPGKWLQPERYSRVLLPLVLGWAIYRLMPYPLSAAPAFHYLTAEYSYPRDTMDMVQANQLHGKVFAYYNWGGFLQWRSPGQLQVFIDGRANTLFDDATYLNYVRVLRNSPDWIQVVEDSGADFFLWPLRAGGGAAKASELWQTGRWQLVYQDAVSYLLARKHVELPSALSSPPPSPYLELTRAQRSYYSGDNTAAIAQATAVLAQMPYQRDACHTLAAALNQARKIRQAALAMDGCRAEFPSLYLR